MGSENSKDKEQAQDTLEDNLNKIVNRTLAQDVDCTIVGRSISSEKIGKGNLKCMYLNADNLLNKREEMEALVCLHTPDLLLVTETVPKSYTTPLDQAEIQIEGYNLITNNGRTKRGVAIYTVKEINATPSLELMNHPFQELTVGQLWSFRATTSYWSDV